MQTSHARAQVIVALRERVNSNVAARLGDRESIQIALAAALRDADDVLGFLLPQHLAKLATKSKEKFKMTTAEWTSLFGVGTQAVRDGGIADIVSSTEFVPITVKMAAALRTTIGEKDQAVVWGRAWAKMLVYVATHMDSPEDTLLSVLGTIIKADNRRIEEMYSSIDDDGPEVLLMTRCIVALSECIA